MDDHEESDRGFPNKKLKAAVDSSGESGSERQSDDSSVRSECDSQSLQVTSQKLAGAKKFIIEMLKHFQAEDPVEYPGKPANDESLEYELDHPRYLDNIWRSLSVELQADREIAMAAFTSEHVKAAELPEPWDSDNEFMKEAVSSNWRLWFDLPEVYQAGDSEMVHSIDVFENAEVIEAVLEKNPQLIEDSELWETIISSPNFEAGYFFENAPSKILSDDALMTLACSCNPAAIKQVGPSLAMDEVFLQKILGITPLSLLHVSSEALEAFPSVVENAFPACFSHWKLKRGHSDHPLYKGDIRSFRVDLRTKRYFAEQWFCAGGHFYPDVFPDAWRDDAEIFLWIAEHVSSDEIAQSFQHLSPRLRSDLRFMRKATGLEAKTWQFAADALKFDLELLVRVLSTEYDAINREQQADPYDYYILYRESRYILDMLTQTQIDSIETYIQEKLGVYRNHRVFLNGFSRATRIGQPAPTLSMLNQGPETTLVFKKRIAGFLGIETPVGEHLRRYWNADYHIRISTSNED